MIHIFSFLPLKQLVICRLVDKRWKEIINKSLSKDHFLKIIFGKDNWETYLGKVGPELHLPVKEIVSMLQKESRKLESYRIVLIPDTINGEALTLDYLGRLVQNPKAGSSTKYHEIDKEILDAYGQKTLTQSYWVLMETGIVPGSEDQDYSEHPSFLKKYGKSYFIPNALEAITCVFTEFVSTGKTFLFPQGKSYTCMYCEPLSDKPVIVGFNSQGLYAGTKSIAYLREMTGFTFLQKF